MAKPKTPKNQESSSTVETPTSPQTQEVITPKVETAPFLALSLVKVPGGWSCVALEIQNGKVIREKSTPADLKMIAEERFKIFASNHLMSLEPFKFS